MAYIYNMTDTWNDNVTTFSAIKMNVTDSASDASSLLMDLQVGGASRFRVSKAGTLTVGSGSATAGSQAITFSGSNLAGIYEAFSQLYLTGNAINAVGQLMVTNNINVTNDAAALRLGASYDALLSRRAAANLRFGAADVASPVAQTLSVQSVVAGTTNTAGANLTITGSQGTGTGAGGSIIFQVAPAGSTGTAQNALATALTLNSDKTSSFGGDIIGPNAAFAIKLFSTNSFEVWHGSIRGFQVNYSTGVKIGNYMGLGWTSGTDVNTTPDLQLFRDAAYILAQRYSTNAQTYRLYGTYTDASNYERGYLTTDSNGFTIGTEALGTGTKRPVRIIGPSLASAESVSILELSQTWNTSGTPTGLKLNVTDTASNAASLLMDLQVGGTSKFKVQKDGGIILSDATSQFVFAATGTTIGRTSGQAVGIGVNGVSAGQINGSSGEFRSISGGWYGFSSHATNVISSPADTILTRRGAANLRLGATDAAAPVAQTLSVQSVIAGTTNAAGANWTFTGSQGTGTGAGGSLIFQVAAAGSSGSAQNALATALTIDHEGQATFTVKNTGGTPTLQIAKSGSASIQVTTTASFSIGSSASSLTLNANAGSSPIYAAGSYLNIGTSVNNDVRLYRDAANTLALRNSTAAQAFRVYNTFTSFGSGTEIWERAAFEWSSNVLRIATSAGANGGSDRAIEVQVGSTRKWQFNAVGTFGIFDGANRESYHNWDAFCVRADTYIGFASSTTVPQGQGDTNLTRVGVGILGVRGGNTTTGGTVSLIEQTAPAAPAANGVYIYAEDDGTGKTRLMARFATGAAQQIAIEP